jgi:hypothetical protein
MTKVPPVKEGGISPPLVELFCRRFFPVDPYTLLFRGLGFRNNLIGRYEMSDVPVFVLREIIAEYGHLPLAVQAAVVKAFVSANISRHCVPP